MCASIERVEIEQVGDRDRRVTADPYGERERVLVGKDRQRDEFLLRTRAHSFSGPAAPFQAGDGPGCTSTGSKVVSLMTVAGGGGGGGSSASASLASVGVGGGNGYNLTPMGDSVGATFSLCRESGERIGVACRVRNGERGETGLWPRARAQARAGATASADVSRTILKFRRNQPLFTIPETERSKIRE